MLIKTVAIYNRISRDNDESEDVLLNHRTITTRLCESKGYKYKLYEEIESGGKFEEREKLIQMLKDIDKGLYDGLVVVELSRIARDNLYSQQIAKVLEENEVPIITPNRIYRLDDDADRFMYDMESMLSSKELKTITRRMKIGKLEGAKRGEWIQGNPPLGYKRGDDKKLEIVESEANIVQQMYNYAENGYGLPNIVSKMMGYKTVNGKPFTTTSIYTILKNQTYIGTITYNVKDKKGKIKDTISIKNAHEAIITREQFNSVQQAIKGRMSGDMETRTRSKGTVLNILKDLVYCKVCGLKMGFKKDSKRKNAIYLKACKCGNKGVAAHRLLETFISEFQFTKSWHYEKWQKALATTETVSKDSLVQQVEEMNKTREKLDAKLKRIRSAYIDEVFTKEEYLSEKSNTEAELKSVSSAIDDLLQDIESMDKESITSQYEDMIEKIDRFYYVYNMEASQQHIAECNRLLKLIINKVLYARGDSESVITSPLERYEASQGMHQDYVEVLIESK